MIGIDGYAFIPSNTRQAVPIINDEITYSEIVKRGWCSPAARILNDPSTKNPSNENGPWFVNEKEAERAVAEKSAFKYEGRYYLFHGSDSYVQPTVSEYERPYWKKGGGGDGDVLDLITSALSAPIIPANWKPYRFHFMTVGHERVDAVVWEDAHQSYSDIVMERSSLPGIGFKYVPDGATHLDDPGDVDRWSEYALAATTAASRFDIYISFPKCVLGPTTCALFELTVETENEVVGVNEYGVKILADKYTSCRLTFRQFLTPKDYRRIPMPRFQPRTATEKVSCYVMNRAEEIKFIEKISNKSINDQVKTLLYGDGSGSILKLMWFYGIRPAISTPQKRKITLGNFIIDDLTVPVFAGDFVQVYMGYVFIRGPFGDYRDYTDARYQMFVPLLGHIDLDPSRVVGKNVHLIYTVNLTDGSAIVTVATTEISKTLEKENGWYETVDNIFTTSITYGNDIPLNVDSVKDVSTRVGEVVSKAVAGGAAGAVAGNVPGALMGAAIGVTSAANPNQTTYSSGTMAPNSNVMGDFTPKIYVKFNKGTAGDISAVVGYPCGKLVKVGEASGYLKAAMVYGTPSTTMQHADEIVNMLKEGIYIS